MFFLGGAIAITLGTLLAVAFILYGADPELLSFALAAGVAVVLGAFFLVAGRDARRFRREWRESLEANRPLPPGGPPK